MKCLNYPGKPHMSVLCKDVGSYSACQRYRFPMGTLVWKVSQILSLSLMCQTALLFSNCFYPMYTELSPYMSHI